MKKNNNNEPQWSTNIKDRVDGENYLLYAIITNSKGKTEEKLITAYWYEKGQAWVIKQDGYIGDNIITVISWLKIPPIPITNTAHAQDFIESLEREEEQRRDNPEDHNEPEFEHENDIDDFDDF